MVTTKFVMQEGAPPLLIMHWDDGDWQFMCGQTEDPKDGVLVCLGCLYEKHPIIGDFADLQRGFEARRNSVDHDWIIDRIVVANET